MAASCTVCGASGTVDPSYNGYAYCHKHFRQLVIRRVRRDLRNNRPLDLKKPYAFRDDGSSLARLTKEILRDIFGPHLELHDDSGVASGEDVIIPSCLEADVSERFERYLAGESLSLPGIRPLRSVSVEDVNALAGSSLEKSSYAHPLLLELDRIQPGAFFAMSNVFKEREKREEKE
ncbi:MAG: hypothetical protein ACLFO2_03270 [Candidatus Woesearchaeota archaeon]